MHHVHHCTSGMEQATLMSLMFQTQAGSDTSVTSTNNGNIVFSGGNPWDYVKLDKNQLATKTINGNSYYDMTLSQQWDELFYLDAATWWLLTTQ